MTKAFARPLCLASAALLACAATALAQAARPFAVGGGEGGGGAEGGITGWLLAEQSQLTHLMAAKVHALHGDPALPGGSIALGLAYGVFHAAGPGHGKALIASYMLANERSLRRGAVMALMAALLQALVAVALVGAAGLVLNATASQMNRAADWLQIASATGVAAIGLWLAWRKGGALIHALRRRFDRAQALASAPAYAGVAWRAPARSLSAAAFRAAPPAADAPADDCCVLPDAATLDGPVFLAQRRRNGDRGRRAALLGRDPGAGVCAGPGAVRRRRRRDLRHGARHGGHDRRARLDGGVRQVGGDALRRGRGFAGRADRAGPRIRRGARGARLRRPAHVRGARRGLSPLGRFSPTCAESGVWPRQINALGEKSSLHFW